MKEINELQELIIEWAKEKNLNDPDKQYLKILEEVGETARAILKNDVPEIKDGIGDIAVTVIIYAHQLETYIEFEPLDTSEYVVKVDKIDCTSMFMDILHRLHLGNVGEQEYWDVLENLNCLATIVDSNLTECLNLAWNEIKDRQGKTVNGTFIKN